MSDHAVLSASSAHRWLTCPPSARLEETEQDQTSAYAEEGTAAHAYAELELSYRLGKINKRSYSGRLKAHKQTAWWGAEMEEAIDLYATQVIEIAESFKQEGYTPYVDLEQCVYFSDFVPEGFGTADVVVLANDTLHVIDLKYGKGVPVDAQDNPQLRLYALGAALKYQMLFGFSRVSMSIIQPRLGASSTDTLGFDDLLAWATDYVAPRAQLAFEGKGDFCPGEHACRFCRIKATCRARAELSLSTALDDFSEFYISDTGEATDQFNFNRIGVGEVKDCLPAKERLTIKEISQLLPVLPIIEAWAKEVQEWALEQARDHSVRFEGYKLVEGRSNRLISDPEAAIGILDETDIESEKYIKPVELQGITALEKALGKKTFSELLGDLVIKPAGKPVLAPECDKRPEISSLESAVEDFKEKE